MLAAWIGLSLLAGAASALRYDAPVEVATSGSAPPVEVAHEGWADVDERRLPPPVSTTTTVAATAAPTPAPPAPTAPPPEPGPVSGR